MFSKITELLINNYDIQNTFLRDNEINNLFNYFNSFDIQYSDLDINYRKNMNNHIDNVSNFIQYPKLIKDIKYLKNEVIITFKVLNTNIVIRIFYLNDISDNLINYLIYVISFVTIICKHNVKDIEIIYYLSNHKKIMNSPHLKKENINSGYCENISSTKSKIVIYRREEILKVTIHEMIHALHQDSYCRNNSYKMNNFYNDKYYIQIDKTNINEAYTEIWANLIHSFLMAKLFHKSNIVFIIILQYEKLFCKIQCNKILSMINKNKNLDINKYTNVLAYFIIRGEIYQNLTNFIKLCRENNDNYILLTNSYYENFLFLQPPLLYSKLNDSILKNTARMSGFSIDL